MASGSDGEQRRASSALFIEYLRPWKLASFCVGLGLLLIGAQYHVAPDWDYPISFIMATLTYLTAPWAVQVSVSRRRFRMAAPGAAADFAREVCGRPQARARV